MLKLYVKEFLGVVKFLLKNKEKLKRGNYLLVEKSVLIELLDKNKFETSDKKLKTWKALNWIDTDQNRITKRIRIDGKQTPFIKINLVVYEALGSMEV